LRRRSSIMIRIRSSRLRSSSCSKTQDAPFQRQYPGFSSALSPRPCGPR
jgi:hypothetical protein